MSLAEFLDNVFLQPLLLICDDGFRRVLGIVKSPGWSLLVFGVLVNLTLLPIYYQMERAGRAGATSRLAMNAEIARIKAHYKGRERYFYIKAIHRQFGHHPIAAVFSSTDLYLQVVVFAAVYRYLAHHSALTGTAFLAIRDLGQPDRLVFGANLLPLVMTLLNVGSAILYGSDKAKRRQSFLLAGLFLVLLYQSPSGLVLYWTSNNAFSLVRNYVEKKVLNALPVGLTRRLSRVANQV